MNRPDATTLEFAKLIGEALARVHLAGDEGARQMNSNSAARQHFNALDAEGKLCAIHQMADNNHRDYSIASATGLSVEMVKELLAERNCA